MNKINFQDLPNTTTPVNATNLNLLQTNIENFIKGTTLYDNSNGTNSTVTLSSDISNMKRLRISGFVNYNNNLNYFSQDIDVVLNQSIGILFNGYRGGTYDYIVKELIQLTSTTITRGVQDMIGVYTSTGEHAGTNTASVSINITKVIGFDY